MDRLAWLRDAAAQRGPQPPAHVDCYLQFCVSFDAAVARCAVDDVVWQLGEAHVPMQVACHIVMRAAAAKDIREREEEGAQVENAVQRTRHAHGMVELDAAMAVLQPPPYSCRALFTISRLLQHLLLPLPPREEEEQGGQAAGARTSVTGGGALHNSPATTPVIDAAMICGQWRRLGTCRFGSRCLYHHEDRGGVSGPDVAQWPSSLLSWVALQQRF